MRKRHSAVSALDVVAVWVRRGGDVARVVGARVGAGANHQVDDRWVHERAICGDPNNDIGAVLAGGKHVSGQHVVLGTSG